MEVKTIQRRSGRKERKRKKEKEKRKKGRGRKKGRRHDFLFLLSFCYICIEYEKFIDIA